MWPWKAVWKVIVTYMCYISCDWIGFDPTASVSVSLSLSLSHTHQLLFCLSLLQGMKMKRLFLVICTSSFVIGSMKIQTKRVS